MKEDDFQTRIQFGLDDKGAWCFQFTDYPVGEDFNPEMPVSYRIHLLDSELWTLIDGVVKQLQKSPARRSKWRRVMEALRS